MAVGRADGQVVRRGIFSVGTRRVASAAGWARRSGTDVGGRRLLWCARSEQWWFWDRDGWWLGGVPAGQWGFWASSGSFWLREGGSEWDRGWSGGSRWLGWFLGGSNLFCRWLLGARPAVDVVEEVGWWTQRFAPQIFPDLMIVLLLNVYLYLFPYFAYSAYLISGIRVIFTHCSVLVLSSIRRIIIRVIFTLCVLVLSRIKFIIPRMVFVTPLWPEFSFGAPFLREFMPLGSLFMPLGSFFFPIWYSDTLQEIMLCKRIITVVGGFGPQSLVDDPILVVYSFGVFCIFNGFVCLFHGTSLFRDLYVLLIELLSAVMDFVQFKD